MSFLTSIWSGNSGSSSFLGDIGNRAKGLVQTGGLSGLADLRNDLRGGGGGSSGTPVGDAYAALTRQQWQDYVQNFVPIENKLIQYATDPSVVTNAMQNASTDVTGAFDAQQGATQRRLKGFGVALDADEQKASDRSFGLAKSLADVGAQNTARDLTVQRQQSVLGNPAPEAIRI